MSDSRRSLVLKNGHSQQLRLSLCMIVRDNERTLEAALSSIRPWVDEMVVVDTGSHDRTREIARALGARVFDCPWCDDFSAARNESLRHARGEWLFWMDSDDTIDQENGRKLRELADGTHTQDVLGYVMQVHCPAYGSEAAGDLTVVDHVKMFRNHPLLRFEFRIHEQVLPAIRRLGGQVAWTDVSVVHSGADHTAEGLERKYERDLRILHLEFQDRPDHPFVLFNLGMTHSEKGEHDRAATYLRRCLVVAQPDESHVRKAYALLMNNLVRLRQYEEARAVCQAGRQLYPKDPELLFREGLLAQELGELQHAEKAYRAVLAGGEDRHFSSVDPGVAGVKARHNLAILYGDMGRMDLAELQWREALRDQPGYGPTVRALGDVLVREGKLAAAEIFAEHICQSDDLRIEGCLLKARVAEASGDLAAARHELEAAVHENADSKEALDALGRFLFEHGETSEAAAALRKLAQLRRDDGAVWHNLGMLYGRDGMLKEAIEALERSVNLRPDSIPTYVQLAQAQDAIGNPEAALNTWRHVRRLEPDNPIASAHLKEPRSAYTGGTAGEAPAPAAELFDYQDEPAQT